MSLNKNWHIIYMYSPKNRRLVETAFRRAGVEVRLWEPTQQVLRKESSGTMEEGLPRGWRPGVVRDDRAIYPGYIFAQYIPPVGDVLDIQLAELKAGHVLKPVGSDLAAEMTEQEFADLEALQQTRIDETLAIGNDLPAGTSIEIKNGPFINYRGVITSAKRDTYIVEVNIFGRASAMEVNKTAVSTIVIDPTL